MAFYKNLIVILAFCPPASMVAGAAELEEIRNYIEYSPTFASAGQPTREQLGLLPGAGFERVIYIAFSNGRNAIPDEDAVVKELGMDYVHIPVIWDAPTKADFYAFVGAMQSESEAKTLLHCAANFRASAFSFLYRVLHEGVPIAEAKADMNKIWTPNQVWTDLIFEVLADNDISPDCQSCDWTVGE